jgi:tetratricopeptide (TPR) repeat protein
VSPPAPKPVSTTPKAVPRSAAVAKAEPRAAASSPGAQPRSHTAAETQYLRKKAEADRRAAEAAAARQAAARAAAARAATAERPNKVVTPRPDRRDYRPDRDYVPYYDPRYRRYRDRYGYDPYYGYYPYGGYGYSPYDYNYGGYGYPYPYGGAYGPATPYYYPWTPFPPPIFMPAGDLFGPAPIMRMMGMDQWPVAGGANFQARDAQAPRDDGAVARAERRPARRADADDAGAADEKPVQRGANDKAVAQAWRFISFGDTHFANQKYASALDRYRSATNSSPTLADGWFRQGMAQAALGRYDQAVKAIKRGLEAKPDWADSDFQLDELFGKDEATKKARIDAMVAAAEADPNNGDLMFMLGIYLYFDGKKDQAAGFLKRASEIGGNDLALKGFIK